MTTQPPNHEAVEAARKYALNDKHLSESDCVLLYGLRLDNKEQIDETVSRILAAEVERLRAQAEEVCGWGCPDPSLAMLQTGCGWECGKTADFCPGCGRKVKIKINENE